MKKFNWGTGIALVIVVFFAAMAALLTIAMRQKTELVTDRYYEQELAYQERINSIRRAVNIPDAVTLVRARDTLAIRLSPRAAAAGMTGTVHFYRPSDRRMDFDAALKLDASLSQRIPTSAMAKGLWRVQIGWSTAGENYFTEQPLIID